MLKRILTAEVKMLAIDFIKMIFSAVTLGIVLAICLMVGILMFAVDGYVAAFVGIFFVGIVLVLFANTTTIEID